MRSSITEERSVKVDKSYLREEELGKMRFEKIK